VGLEVITVPIRSNWLVAAPYCFCAGIMFQDITTLLLDPKAFRDTIDLFVERYKDQGITVVAGNV
jgi:adenine/guanine phosphoribosyltransferase-like PRPP-binding protein